MKSSNKGPEWHTLLCISTIKHFDEKGGVIEEIVLRQRLSARSVKMCKEQKTSFPS